MILNVHRLDTDNVGDIRSAPASYINELTTAHRLEITGYDPEVYGLQASLEWHEKVEKADLIIVGGGGLIGNEFFAQSLIKLFKSKRKDSKIVLWGAGHNQWTLNDWRELKFRVNFSDFPFDLIGIRDDNQAYNWVPCASCLAPEFDAFRGLSPVREIGLYVHENSLKDETMTIRLPSGMPRLSNDASFGEAIDFIAGCSLLLTDSYHGVYWATLLGRRVVAFPSSSKFYDLRHSVPLCVPEDWRRSARLAIEYPEALSECRNANLDFWSQCQLQIASKSS